MMLCRSILTLLTFIALGGNVRAQLAGLPLGGGTPAASKVTAEIAADTTAAEGKPFLAAVTLDTSSNWHIYWSNPGAGGYPTTFKWETPAGCKVEPLVFPIPHGFVQPGDIHVVGYEGKTTFLFRIIPPAGAAAPVKLSVTADWLNCNKDQCVPGKATLELALPAGKAEAANKELFTEAMSHLPAPSPTAAFVTAAAPVAVAGKDETWQLQLAWAKMPKDVEVFPAAVEGLDMTVGAITTTPGNPMNGPLVIMSRALAASSMVEIKSHVFAGQKVTVEKIPLLVAYTAEDGRRTGFYLEVDAAAIGARPK
jgi:DsbC/DsbD-like thiol-disulfide interchange protein